MITKAAARRHSRSAGGASAATSLRVTSPQSLLGRVQGLFVNRDDLYRPRQLASSHPSGRALRAPTPNLRGALSTSSKLVNPAERGSEAKVVASESSNSDRAVANLRLVAEPNREALEVDASGTWTLASLGR